jgi:endonuclease/exonuclease/phosphatase family metal-dependent hydrolase
VQVFTTHLQTGGCSNDAQARYNSMSYLKSWAGNYSQPQIVAGDFNADPDQIDTTSGMLPSFVDSWPIVGSGRGFTAFASNPTMKLDYWFSDSGGRAQPTFTMVVTSTGTVSDHYPVQATFNIR